MSDSPLGIQADIERLKELARFGGDKLEYIQFSDGQEYHCTLERVVKHFLSAPPPQEPPDVTAAHWSEADYLALAQRYCGEVGALQITVRTLAKILRIHDEALALRTGGAGVPSEKYYACYDYGSCNDGSHSSNVVECETLEGAREEIASHRTSLIIENGWASIIRGAIVQEFRNGRLLDGPAAKGEK